MINYTRASWRPSHVPPAVRVPRTPDGTRTTYPRRYTSHVSSGGTRLTYPQRVRIPRTPGGTHLTYPRGYAHPSLANSCPKVIWGVNEIAPLCIYVGGECRMVQYAMNTGGSKATPNSMNQRYLQIPRNSNKEEWGEISCCLYICLCAEVRSILGGLMFSIITGQWQHVFRYHTFHLVCRIPGNVASNLLVNKRQFPPTTSPGTDHTRESFVYIKSQGP